MHLPAGLVHCLENVGPGEMRVLGVFRPAGSPAEAYYPDGTAGRRTRCRTSSAPRTIAWEGNVARGGGTISAATSGAFSELGFSLPTRIGQAGGEDEPRGAARRSARRLHHDVARGRALERRHAARPARRDAARIVMDEVEGQGHQIVGSHVEFVVAVEGLDDGRAPGRGREGGRGLSVLAAAEARGRRRAVTARLA